MLTGCTPGWPRCIPRASGVLLLYTAGDTEEEGSAGLEEDWGLVVGASVVSAGSGVTCCFAGGAGGGMIALNTWSWAFQPFLVWQVTIKTFFPGAGAPNLAV